MTQATSPFLNQPPRSEQQARIDQERIAAEQDCMERQRRLDDHGATFCRAILDGAFERVYGPDGSYVLRQIVTMQDGFERPAAFTPESTAGHEIMRSGYTAALRDLSSWVSVAAVEACMDATTLAALNSEIARLSRGLNTAPIGEHASR